MPKCMVVTGVSGERPEDKDRRVQREVADLLGFDPEDVLVYNPEHLFNQSLFNITAQWLIGFGAAWLQARFYFDARKLAQESGSKASDVWLYLNPVWHRTRNAIDREVSGHIRRNPGMLLLGYSLGSVILYRALKVSLAGPETFCHVKHMGSPLWMGIVRRLIDAGEKGLVNVESQENYYSGFDPVALKPIPKPIGTDEQWDAGVFHKLADYLAYSKHPQRAHMPKL